MEQYRFVLARIVQGSGSTRNVTPIYSNSVELGYTKEDNAQYFRAKSNGKFTFLKDDYAFIANATIDARFVLTILTQEGSIPIVQMTFAKTDCEIDFENKILTVTPNANDSYNNLLSGIDNEYDLIELAPAMRDVKLDKRMSLQLYTPGSNVLGCFISGIYWEQPCSEVDDMNELINTYHFGVSSIRREIILDEDRPVQLPDFFGGVNIYGSQTQEYKNGNYTMRVQIFSSNNTMRYSILENTTLLYETPIYSLGADPATIDFRAPSSTTTIFQASVTKINILGRYLLNKTQVAGLTIFPLPSLDISDENRNYTHCAPLSMASGVPASFIIYSSNLTSAKTKYGTYQPNLYYDLPTGHFANDTYPIAKSAWGRMSIWIDALTYPWTTEIAARKEYTLRYSYTLASVISTLLAKIGANVTYAPDADHSLFFHGECPIRPIEMDDLVLMVAPKSNVLAGEFDEPAKKAPITLGKVFEMLAKVFKCYWYIDGGKLRIEHLSYFKNGGSYTTNTSIGVNLNSIYAPNGKPWSMGLGKISYDKIEMPERYEFGWMDEVSSVFEGKPMIMDSEYVEKGRIEKISVDNFTSDIDYMLLNPKSCDLNGFALLFPRETSGELKLPYYTFGTIVEQNTHNTQNGYVSFDYLERYSHLLDRDLPSRTYHIEDESLQRTALGVSKKLQQRVVFPAIVTPNLYQLIIAGMKDNLGNDLGGTIRSMTINMTSRKCEATLEYENDIEIPT